LTLSLLYRKPVGTEQLHLGDVIWAEKSELDETLNTVGVSLWHDDPTQSKDVSSTKPFFGWQDPRWNSVSTNRPHQCLPLQN